MYNWSLLLDIITYTSRLIVVTPNWGVIFLRAVELGDKLSDVQEEMRKTKLMLDKDCIFFWRIFLALVSCTSEELRKPLLLLEEAYYPPTILSSYLVRLIRLSMLNW